MTFREVKDRQEQFFDKLKAMERATNTIEAYRSDLKMFFQWAGDERDGEQLTKSDVVAYKEHLRDAGRATTTINRAVISLNKYLKWAGAEDAAGTKQLKTQRRSTLENVISYADYERLLRVLLDPPEQARRAGLREDLQAWAILQTIAGTGIRYGELQYFTVEAVQAAKKTGHITVTNKGKERSIPVNKSLYKLLTDYCRDKGIESGIIFVTKYGNPISNEQLTRRLKRIAGYARINKSKVHPHNFRHLFAKEYMEKVGRLDKLRDILGHSDINTTTIYTKATAKEMADDTETLGMVQAYPQAKGKRKRQKGKS